MITIQMSKKVLTNSLDRIMPPGIHVDSDKNTGINTVHALGTFSAKDGMTSDARNASGAHTDFR